MNWQNVTVKLSDLQPWEHNPRTMTKKQAQRLLKSWQNLGQFQTIAIGPSDNGSGYPVYDGHQRLSALLATYGAQYPIDARQCDRALTEDERRYLITQANLPVGAWRFEEIAGWPEAQEWGFDAEMLQTWNSDAAALATMLEAEQPQGDADAEPQIDRAAELNEKWQVQRGDLWRIGEHRLLCGDSTKREDVERVMGGEKADCVIADAPYGINLDSATSRLQREKDGWRNKSKDYAPIIGDDKPFDRRTIPIEAKEEFWFGADYYADTLPGFGKDGSWLVWDKRLVEDLDVMLGSVFELCWSKQKHKREIIRVRWVGLHGTESQDVRERVHPTQKPIEVIGWILQKYGNGIVIDPFAGSGTTLVACQNLQRKCRAIEISPAYCAVVLERMATAFPGIEIERVSEVVLTHGT